MARMKIDVPPPKKSTSSRMYRPSCGVILRFKAYFLINDKYLAWKFIRPDSFYNTTFYCEHLLFKPWETPVICLSAQAVASIVQVQHPKQDGKNQVYRNVPIE